MFVKRSFSSTPICTHLLAAVLAAAIGFVGTWLIGTRMLVPPQSLRLSHRGDARAHRWPRPCPSEWPSPNRVYFASVFGYRCTRLEYHDASDTSMTNYYDGTMYEYGWPAFAFRDLEIMWPASALGTEAIAPTGSAAAATRVLIVSRQLQLGGYLVNSAALSVPIYLLFVAGIVLPKRCLLHRRQTAMMCVECGYALSTPSGRLEVCPECGASSPKAT